MLYPLMQQLTNDKVNRYSLVIATAKGARIITDKLAQEREEAELRRDSKEAKPSVSPDSVNDKAVSETVKRIHSGEYKIIVPEEN